MMRKLPPGESPERERTHKRRKREEKNEEPQDPKTVGPPPVKEHPLLNSVVLQNLCSFLAEKDLRSCRLVHTTWNREAVPHLKRRCKFLEAFYILNSQFIKCVKLSPDFPFTKINIRRPGVLASEAPETWDALLRCLSPRLTSLEVFIDSTAKALPHGIDFPKLTALDFKEFRSSSPDFLPSLLGKCSGQLTSLGVLSGKGETIQLLVNSPSLRLAKLTLRICQMNQIEWIKAFLNKQRDTLTHLELSSFSPNVCLKSIRFSKLKTLKVYGFHNFGQYERAGVPFPELTTLTVAEVEGYPRTLTAQDFWNLMGGQPATTVRTLELPSHEPQTAYASDVLEVLPKLFPNLKRLMVSATFPKLMPFLETLSNVTEMEISFNVDAVDVLTAQLTGFGRWKLNWIGAHGLTNGKMAEMEHEFQRKMKQSPYSALQRIERVKLCATTGKYLDDLELPCRLVFLQMQSLKQLHVIPCKNYILLGERMQLLLKEMRKKFVVMWESQAG